MEQKLNVFSALGKKLRISLNTEIIDRTIRSNNWFTEQSIRQSVDGISHMLEEDKLRQWALSYSEIKTPKTIGLILAGNIPMVGFHDLLCTLIAGHNVKIKISSKDNVLIPWIIKELLQLEPELKKRINLVDQIKEIDAVIATGSDNSSTYFNQYFSRYPHIIRKNRVSCAVITGEETDSDLAAIGKDIFSYYGLGCRNVSKLYIPEEYEIEKLITSFEEYSWVIDHHKYANNYDYNKSIYLVNKEAHYDNGFALFKESSDLVSPISVIYFEKYSDWNDVSGKILSHQDKTQCLVSISEKISPRIEPGKAQLPELWDYADHIDTMKFLTNL